MEHTLLQQVIRNQEHIVLCGKNFYAHPTGALIWPEEETLIIADTYLRSGYVLNALMAGSNKPLATEIINSIASLIKTYKIKQVIAVGRVFRRLDDPYHMESTDLTTLYNMQKNVDWIWVAGPMARQLPNMVGGIRAASFNHADINFRVTPLKTETSHEIAAGMYPMARVEARMESRVEPRIETNLEAQFEDQLKNHSSQHQIADASTAPDASTANVISFNQAATLFQKNKSQPSEMQFSAPEAPSLALNHQQHETTLEKGVMPCFVSNGKRLLMPAFGGKLCARNILGDEFLPLFGYDDLMIQAIDSYKTYPIPHHELLAG